MNLIELLRENCERLGRKPAFIEKGAATGYDAFYRRVRGLAAGLLARGIGAGDNVLVLMPLSLDLYASLCAVWAAGACVVVFDPSAGRKHVAACLEAIPAAAFVGSRQTLLLRLPYRPLRRIPRHFTPARLYASVAADFAIAPAEPDTPALITFTSGSTGLPKAIVRSHGFLLEQRAALTAALPYRRDDVDLAVLAVFTLVNLLEGVTTVLPDDSLRDIAKVNAGKLVRQMQSCGVTRITASPKLLEKLSVWALAHGKRLDQLRSVNIGGGPVYLDVLDTVAQATDPRAIRLVYGSSEAEPIAELPFSAITPEDRRSMQEGGGLLAGAPAAGVSLRIIAARAGPLTAGDLTPLAEGQWGEIAVAGRHVVRGYLNPAQDRLTKVPAGAVLWHRTGDCGFLDARGRLWLLGRVSQVLSTPRGPVFPFAVEGALRAKYRCLAAVCAVDGKPVLAVEPNSMTEHIRREYGSRFSVVTVKKIPLDRRHSSKVDYTALAGLVRRAKRNRADPE
ncbi:MAG: AMP-binding protein [Gracilibacteraceae bacterium]|nr:AMP-binding protein [Gracilibacteraceae bacterium]